MKYVDEFRDRAAVAHLAARLEQVTTRPWTIMEVCGGQTHAVLRFGIDKMLPDAISLIHGPGCPVCVTPSSMIDLAIDLAGRDEVALCTFGDMLRVPGSSRSLLEARAAGADVQVVYSPLDAVALAAENRDRHVVFFAVGFETTAPATAIAVEQAGNRGLSNFSMLVAHVLVRPAMEAIVKSDDCRVQGFLAAGHVCAVTGWREYESLAIGSGVPIVVTGFEPVDLLKGLAACVGQLEEGRAQVENQYRRAVQPDGNREARALIEKVYARGDRQWRGLGLIPGSGLTLRPEYSRYDARRRFDLREPEPARQTECISGDVLRGRRRPVDCPAFGKRCTPEHPLGATMVSSEGACAAYFEYRLPTIGQP
jgi:hydrogenase expression/formation protein HypD